MSCSIKLEFLKNAIVSDSDAQKLGVKSPKCEKLYYISGTDPNGKFIALQYIVLFIFVVRKF